MTRLFHVFPGWPGVGVPFLGASGDGSCPYPIIHWGRDALRQTRVEEVGEAAGLKLSEQDMAAERILATQASLPPPTQDHSRLWEWHPQAVVKSGNSSQGRPRHPPLAPRGWVRRAGQGIIFDFLFAIVSAGINKRLPLPKILNSLVRNSPRR